MPANTRVPKTCIPNMLDLEIKFPTNCSMLSLFFIIIYLLPPPPPSDCAFYTNAKIINLQGFLCIRYSTGSSPAGNEAILHLQQFSPLHVTFIPQKA